MRLHLSYFGQAVVMAALENGPEAMANTLRGRIDSCWQTNVIIVEQQELSLLSAKLERHMSPQARPMMVRIIGRHLRLGMQRALQSEQLVPNTTLDFKEGDLQPQLLVFGRQLDDRQRSKEVPQLLENFWQQHFPAFGYYPTMADGLRGTVMPVAFNQDGPLLARLLAMELEQLADMPAVDFSFPH